MNLLPWLLLAAAMPTAVLTPKPDAGHQFATRESSFELSLPSENAFPLFEPEGERRWAEGWNPVFASSTDTPVREGSVFTVAHPNGLSSVWAVTRYEPPHRIQYRNIVGNRRTTCITVICAPTGPATRVTVRYEYRGLNEEGDAAIADITETKFQEMIAGWKSSIDAALPRGTPASP